MHLCINGPKAEHYSIKIFHLLKVLKLIGKAVVRNYVNFVNGIFNDKIDR